MSDGVESLKREQERTKEVMLETKRQLSAAMDEKLGPPADDPEQAEEQLHTIRGSIERDLATLRGRIPETDELASSARKVGLAVGGGLGTIMLFARTRARRNARKEHEERLREQAQALAERFARLDLEAIAAEAAAERAAEEQRGGRGKLVVLVLALVAAGIAWWSQTRTREEPDVWGPDPVPPADPDALPPLSEGQPATPTDITTEVPTIPIDEPPARPR